jgi:dipeptidyl aminopeptidase/acylaminoacyl peptidase
VSKVDGGQTLGVRILTDAEATIWLDERLKAVQKAADARMPDRVNRLTCRRCGEPDMVVLVYSFSDRDPGQYWVYFADGERWQPVGVARPGIAPQQMATTAFERIRARDGRDLPLWITQPSGPKESRAAVVLVHGGPWLRGRSWEWNATAQFLASRGYVVLEPEFRGSLGYGRKHYEAGWRQWGRAMQDDLADSVLWATQRGLIDPRRVCVAGGSYGGYAALMELVRHPNLYRCGVAWAAVSDLRLMIDWWWGSDVSDEARVHGWNRLIGDPVKDAAMLAENSPVQQAHRIKAPVMLVHGAKDRRVSIEHATAMREALRKAGQEPEWVTYADEGHGWLNVETRVDFAQRLERFLALHLKSN